jgi:hypothetical protein
VPRCLDQIITYRRFVKCRIKIKDPLILGRISGRESGLSKKDMCGGSVMEKR